ncbi:MAG TPA: hypothetical protein VF629_03665 [Hymenobacter sp.]|uniref:hypothetical protein n=1 Tax=Hymenobacter sp. TaxID=1898978 RepID=UPI002EDA23A1
MMYRFGLLWLLYSLSGCRPASSGAPLLGHWRFQQQHQVLYRPDGTVLEASTQRPPQAQYRSLDITPRELIYHHVLEDRSFPGDSTYTVARSYTRQDSTLWVVPVPGIEAGPVFLHRLTNQHLTLRVAQERVPGAPYSVWDLSFTR